MAGSHATSREASHTRGSTRASLHEVLARPCSMLLIVMLACAYTPSIHACGGGGHSQRHSHSMGVGSGTGEATFQDSQMGRELEIVAAAGGDDLAGEAHTREVGNLLVTDLGEAGSTCTGWDALSVA